MTLEDKYVRVPDMLASEVDGELVMLSIENGKYYLLNYVAKEIWNLLDRPIRLSDVCLALITQFDVAVLQCEQEVLNLVARLLEQKLVRKCVG